MAKISLAPNSYSKERSTAEALPAPPQAASSQTSINIESVATLTQAVQRPSAVSKSNLLFLYDVHTNVHFILKLRKSQRVSYLCHNNINLNDRAAHFI